MSNNYYQEGGDSTMLFNFIEKYKLYEIDEIKEIKEESKSNTDDKNKFKNSITEIIILDKDQNLQDTINNSKDVFNIRYLYDNIEKFDNNFHKDNVINDKYKKKMNYKKHYFEKMSKVYKLYTRGRLSNTAYSDYADYLRPIKPLGNDVIKMGGSKRSINIENLLTQHLYIFNPIGVEKDSILWYKLAKKLEDKKYQNTEIDGLFNKYFNEINNNLSNDDKNTFELFKLICVLLWEQSGEYEQKGTNTGGQNGGYVINSWKDSSPKRKWMFVALLMYVWNFFLLFEGMYNVISVINRITDLRQEYGGNKEFDHSQSNFYSIYNVFWEMMGIGVVQFILLLQQRCIERGYELYNESLEVSKQVANNSWQRGISVFINDILTGTSSDEITSQIQIQAQGKFQQVINDIQSRALSIRTESISSFSALINGVNGVITATHVMNYALSDTSGDFEFYNMIVTLNSYFINIRDPLSLISTITPVSATVSMVKNITNKIYNVEPPIEIKEITNVINDDTNWDLYKNEVKDEVKDNVINNSIGKLNVNEITSLDIHALAASQKEGGSKKKLYKNKKKKFTFKKLRMGSKKTMRRRR